MSEVQGVFPSPYLSICIATYNRGHFIGATLDSLLPQLSPEVEVVVVDGNSSDNTSQILRQYEEQFSVVRYFRETANSGLDQDYDKAVSYAHGDYCWLMSDDDLLKEGAIEAVLAKLAAEPDLVVVNAEIRNRDFSVVLQPSCLPLDKDQTYATTDFEKFCVENLNYLTFIGGVVIRRALWMSRQREPYYGSYFIHVGVICQSAISGVISTIAQPQMMIRYGNATWSAKGFEIWMFKWPELIWSFIPLNERTKKMICARQPWRKARNLLIHRAIGSYSISEFHRFIPIRGETTARLVAFLVALCPAAIANMWVMIYFSLFKRSSLVRIHDLLNSPHVTLLIQRWAKCVRLM